MTTQTVKNLDPKNQVVMYWGDIYKIQNISIEGSLRRVELTSLIPPRKITSAVWHSESTITSSLLTTKRCLIIRHIKDNIFEIENGDDSLTELDIGDWKHQVIKWLIEGKLVCVTLFYCFDSMYIGSIYTLPKFSSSYHCYL